jgi:hypothetical protein
MAKAIAPTRQQGQTQAQRAGQNLSVIQVRPTNDQLRSLILCHLAATKQPLCMGKLGFWAATYPRTG